MIGIAMGHDPYANNRKWQLIRRDDPHRISIAIEHPDGTVDDRLIPGETCRPLLPNFRPMMFSIQAVDWDTDETLYILDIPRAPMQSGDNLTFTLPPDFGKALSA